MIYRIIFLIILINSSSLYSQVAVDWVARYDGGFGDDLGLALAIGSLFTNEKNDLVKIILNKF